MRHPALICLLTVLTACGNDTELVSNPPAHSTLPVKSVQLNTTFISIVTGNTFQFSATAYDGEGSIIAGKTPIWSSDDSRIISISNSGTASGILAGITTVSAIIDGVLSRATVSVTGTGPVALDNVLGDNQTSEVGSLPISAPTVRVRDVHNHGVPGIAVTFTVVTGDGTVTNAQDTTDTNGLAHALWHLGPIPGQNVLSASTAWFATSFVATGSYYRSLADRSDEVAGHSVHFIYAVAHDGEDRALDISGRLATSITIFQRFASTNTNGHRLRIDTFNGGVPDITFVRLEETDAQINATLTPQQNVEASLHRIGLLKTGKIYAVYYDGSSRNACGQADLSLAAGQVGMVYLKGNFDNGTQPCLPLSAMAATVYDVPHYWDFVMLHEILHVMGIVSPSAPHYVDTPPGHVSDPSDLMYSGNATWTPTQFDRNNDDYSGTKLPPSLTNFLTSPFTETEDLKSKIGGLGNRDFNLRLSGSLSPLSDLGSRISGFSISFQ